MQNDSITNAATDEYLHCSNCGLSRLKSTLTPSKEGGVCADCNRTEATLYRSQQTEIVADLDCYREMCAKCGCLTRAANLRRAAELIAVMDAKPDEEPPF